MGFADVVGQELAKKTIMNSLEAGRLASSYLFYGPRGVGKATTAFVLAKALSCKEGRADSCDNCTSCRRIENLNYPDVRVILPVPSGVKLEDVDWMPRDGSPNFGQKASISIDTIRSLRKEISLKPFEGEKRLIVILEADSMTTEASNAFLKSLEEPPLDTTFVLTTTKPSFLLPTILSRCQRIPFRRLKRQQIEEFLVKQLAMEKERAKFLSLLSDGSLGKALELADEKTEGDRQRVLDFIFLAPGERWGALDEREIQADLEEVVQSLLLVYRDLLVLKETGEEGVVNLDILPRLRRKAQAISSGEIRGSIDSLMDASRALARNVNPKLIWNNLTVELC